MRPLIVGILIAGAGFYMEANHPPQLAAVLGLIQIILGVGLFSLGLWKLIRGASHDQG